MNIFMLFILCTQLRDKRHQPASIFQSFVVRLRFDHSQNENASRASFAVVVVCTVEDIKKILGMDKMSS